VICGVGHETDVTLCDLAADLRAPTPTAAAELACTPRGELLGVLQRHADTLQRSVARRLQTQAQRLDLAALRLARPARGLARLRQRVDAQANALHGALQRRMDAHGRALPQRVERLQQALSGLLRRQRERLDSQAHRLDALDPHAVLGRGYAWVEAADGRPVTAVAGLRPGDAVQGVWADGRAALQVQGVSPAPAPAAARRRVGSRRSA
jgi:exodeoxyribonuclease VII large subunit